MATYEDEHRISTKVTQRREDGARHTNGAVEDFMDMRRDSPRTNRADDAGHRPLVPGMELLELLGSLGGGGGHGLLEALVSDLRNNTREGNPPTSAGVISTLPTKKTNGECPICTDDFAGSEAVYLPCKHTFHNSCLVPWLKARNTCPLCRHELPTDDEEYERKRRAKKMEELKKSLPPDSDEDDYDSMYG